MLSKSLNSTEAPVILRCNENPADEKHISYQTFEYYFPKFQPLIHTKAPKLTFLTAGSADSDPSPIPTPTPRTPPPLSSTPTATPETSPTSSPSPTPTPTMGCSLLSPGPAFVCVGSTWISHVSVVLGVNCTSLFLSLSLLFR